MARCEPIHRLTESELLELLRQGRVASAKLIAKLIREAAEDLPEEIDATSAMLALAVTIEKMAVEIGNDLGVAQGNA